MKRAAFLCASLLMVCVPLASAQESAFDSFLTKFDYETRADMKIDSKRLITLLAEKKAVLVDIRFPEETKAWKMGFGLFIPLNELPARFKALPRDKIIVTACPHKASTAMARNSRSGLVGFMTALLVTGSGPGRLLHRSGHPGSGRSA